jgi:hypothetical protein
MGRRIWDWVGRLGPGAVGRGKEPTSRVLRKDLILGELVGADVAKLRKDMILRDLGCWRGNLSWSSGVGRLGFADARDIHHSVS